MNRKIIGFAALIVIAALLAPAVFAAGQQGSQSSSASGEWKWERKVTFISPWGPGGGSGPTIRLIVPEVEKVIKVPCEVQHIEGAGGATGAIAGQRQPADGYNFLLATQSQILLDLQGSLPFNFKEEFIPVGKLVHSTNGLMGSAKALQGKFSDFKGFINYVKANPKTITCAMLSSGGTDQASLYQLLSLSLGVPINQVTDYVKITPYGDGAEIDAALVGGHIDACIAGPGDEAGLIESGDVIPLVVLSETRLKSFPNIPCTGEMGIAAYIGTWRGIWAKKGTPQAAMTAMDKALREAWGSQAYQNFCHENGYDERTGYESQEDFKKLVDSEYKVFEDFLKATGQLKK